MLPCARRATPSSLYLLLSLPLLYTHKFRQIHTNVNTQPSFWSSWTDMLRTMWILYHYINGNGLFAHFNCTSRVHVAIFSKYICWVHVVLWHFPYFTFYFFFNSTEMQVSVPCSSLSMVVTVRCGHCTSLLSVNMMKASFVPFHLLASLSHLEVIGYLSNSMFVWCCCSESNDPHTHL